MKKINTQRRGFITGTGSLLTLAALAPNIPSAFGSEQALENQSMVVYRAQDQHSLEFASVFAEAGASVMALGIDPVRQWRDGFSAALKEKQALIGLTNWSDFLLMRELAFEHKRYPVLEDQHSVLQTGNEIWALEEANKILSLTQHNEIKNLTTPVAGAFASTLNGKSLFSWVIA